MEKLKEGLRNMRDKLKSMKLGTKIALGISLIAFIIAIIFLSTYMKSNKYGVLFSNLDPADAKVVTEKIKEKKVKVEVRGNSIYVPKEMVDELRLELATEISNGSKGYELLDDGNSFGMTDEEFSVKKQRMLQGEIEKTIKSFPQVKNARVHLTPAKDSVFVKDAKPGKSSVYLELNQGEKIDEEQVKSIVALISGAAQNIPKESVEVIDDKMNLLSKDIYDDNAMSIAALDKHKQAEIDYETKLESSVLDMLETVIGRDRVKVKVNSDLDFDAVEENKIVIDPEKVPVSESSLKETSNGGEERAAQSPVDNNMNNTIANNNGNVSTTKEELNTNYELGKTERKVIAAPGEVKRLTASVVVDGNLDERMEESIKSLVSNAIGYKADRGDEVSVVGMTFDPTLKDNAKKEIEDMQKQAEAENKRKLYRNIGIALVSLLAIIIVLVILRKRKEEDIEDELEGLDVIIGDNIEPKEKVEFAPIEFESNSESNHIEKEIKKYASEKPDQVIDIVKSWISEDER
ncbi:flagellar basal-body MS-ring/collar protein FliF [Clostridium algidicarnis]|uniref:flagellar basal-body MS-ring/collar protein FliF n=1 Tax=Clostridium algidicarnis TaxID=37659 RepID=UPI001C0BBD92|nr:flagellar basal-body MS-ring/collar protein FliF [Clostridium algidicarnis]MBU3193958.1 flagellar M-ring protein FliF [Clostridium algidicarnis]